MVERTSDGEFHSILNDFDLAGCTDKVPNNGHSSLHHTGTLPFMAVELLTDNLVVHPFQHDLKSYFYILVWISAHYDEGGQDSFQDVLSSWHTGSLEIVRGIKADFVAQPSELCNLPLTDFYKPLKTTWLEPLCTIIHLIHRTWRDNMHTNLPQQPIKSDTELYSEFSEVLFNLP